MRNREEKEGATNESETRSLDGIEANGDLITIIRSDKLREMREIKEGGGGGRGGAFFEVSSNQIERVCVSTSRLMEIEKGGGRKRNGRVKIKSERE